MSNDPAMAVYRAGLCAQYAMNSLFQSHWTKRFCTVTAAMKVDDAVEQLEKAAAELGYELVKRGEKQEAA